MLSPRERRERPASALKGAVPVAIRRAFLKKGRLALLQPAPEPSPPPQQSMLRTATWEGTPAAIRKGPPSRASRSTPA